MSLYDLTAKLRTPDVHFVGQVTNAELSAFYNVADVFLCASEHEGFCVPLVEAFHERVPVIAYAATAVPDTMDGGGVLYNAKDPSVVAALLPGIISNQALCETVLDAQDSALDRYLNHDFSATLMQFVNQILEGPRLQPWELRGDFWQKFDADRDVLKHDR